MERFPEFLRATLLANAASKVRRWATQDRDIDPLMMSGMTIARRLMKRLVSVDGTDQDPRGPRSHRNKIRSSSDSSQLSFRIYHDGGIVVFRRSRPFGCDVDLFRVANSHDAFIFQSGRTSP